MPPLATSTVLQQLVILCLSKSAVVLTVYSKGLLELGLETGPLE